MPKNFVKKTFDRWIKINRDKFQFNPWISESRKTSFTLRFSGLASELTCTINKDGRAEIYIHDRQGRYWDIIRDFDIHEQRSLDGKYYCKSCKNPTYYPTRSLLWENHIFEAIRTWINELNTDTRICFYGIPEKSGWGAELINAHDIKLEDNVENCFPVIL